MRCRGFDVCVGGFLVGVVWAEREVGVVLRLGDEMLPQDEVLRMEPPEVANCYTDKIKHTIKHK